jgi:VWFA-related protein
MHKMLIAASCVLLAASPRSRETQVFRASADAIEIQAQVIGEGGTPIRDLKKDEFRVTIAGTRRVVMDAEFIDFLAMDTIDRQASDRATSPAVSPSHTEISRQTFVLAIDASTFPPDASPGVSEAAARFIRSLPSNAPVGLFTFPLGPRAEPTTDHEAIARALTRFSGQRAAVLGGRYNLRFSELIDYTAGAERQAIVRAHCGLIDRMCAQALDEEVWTTVGQYEAEARASLGMLHDLLMRMRAITGRKILVLVSEGVPLTDRPGGRPDVGDVSSDIGRAASEANTVIYCLYIDRNVLGAC